MINTSNGNYEKGHKANNLTVNIQFNHATFHYILKGIEWLSCETQIIIKCVYAYRPAARKFIPKISYVEVRVFYSLKSE